MGAAKSDYARTGIRRELEARDFTVNAKKGIDKYGRLSSDEMAAISQDWKRKNPGKGINNYKINFFEYINKRVK